MAGVAMLDDPAATLESRRRREFRRMVVVSAVLHLSALGVAVSRPAPRAIAAPAAISVELVSDPTKPSRPAAAVRPPAPAPKPKPAKKVLPARPTQPKPKAQPKPAPERKEVVIEPKPKQEKSLEDLLADFREEQGESAPPAASPTATAAVPTPGAPGGTARVSPEVADWMRRAKIHVKRAWVVPPGFRNELLTTHVVVKLDGQGNVVGTPEIARRSGNPWYDEGVVRGIQKASPLPPPPEPGDWDFVFIPEDAY